MNTEMLSPEWQEAVQRGRQDAEREMEEHSSYITWVESATRLRDEAAEMVRYCWETDRGWTKYAYYSAKQRTFQEALDAYRAGLK